MRKIWLIIDTACPRGVVAISCAKNIIASYYMLNHQQHGETLIWAIEHCLSKANIQIQDLYAIAVGTGPGSFTGVRIALAHAKGLAIARNIPLIGLNSLAGIDSKGHSHIAIKAKDQAFYSWTIKENIFETINKLHSSTQLEINGPTAENLMKLLPEIAYDKTFDLTPNYNTRSY